MCLNPILLVCLFVCLLALPVDKCHHLSALTWQCSIQGSLFFFFFSFFVVSSTTPSIQTTIHPTPSHSIPSHSVPNHVYSVPRSRFYRNLSLCFTHLSFFHLLLVCLSFRGRNWPARLVKRREKRARSYILLTSLHFIFVKGRKKKKKTIGLATLWGDGEGEGLWIM